MRKQQRGKELDKQQAQPIPAPRVLMFVCDDDLELFGIELFDELGRDANPWREKANGEREGASAFDVPDVVLFIMICVLSDWI